MHSELHATNIINAVRCACWDEPIQPWIARQATEYLLSSAKDESWIGPARRLLKLIIRYERATTDLEKFLARARIKEVMFQIDSLVLLLHDPNDRKKAVTSNSTGQ